jgi:endonuclease/exonuclease/phosphatase family metal-dependent hydrolase
MRLATFNILHGRSLTDGHVDLDRYRRAIRLIDADVLALQEVDRDQPRSHLADLTAVAADAMGAIEHRFVAAVSGTPGATWVAATGDEQPGTASYGIALLSRYPAASWQVIRLPRVLGRFPMWLPGPRRVVIVREEPRTAVVAQLDTPLGRLAVANTHLSFVPGWTQLQLRTLRRNLDALPDPVMLLGDLNLTEPRAAVRAGYRSIGQRPTFPADAPVRQLDHVLVRGDLPAAVSVDTPAIGFSDHRPLVVEFAGGR